MWANRTSISRTPPPEPLAHLDRCRSGLQTPVWRTFLRRLWLSKHLITLLSGREANPGYGKDCFLLEVAEAILREVKEHRVAVFKGGGTSQVAIAFV